MIETNSRSSKTALRPTRFDGIVLLVITGLALAIGATILMGDRVGVIVDRYGPTEETSSTALVSLSFSETMNWESVIEHVQFSPELSGEFRWSGKTLRFTPSQPLQPGTDYNVRLAAGAESTGRRKVLQDVTFSFRVRSPRIAYLTPADAVPANIWMADVDQPENATQISFSPTGIVNFSASPDGTMIAFAEHTEAGTSDIKLLDLENGTISQLTNCEDSNCDTPVWRPDGSMVAYHRIDLNTGISGLGVSPTRVWVVDLTTTPYSNRPLFTDNQILGFSPQWSADGSRIAIYDSSSYSVYIKDFSDDSTIMVPLGDAGSDAALSPDGKQLSFARLVIDDQTNDFQFDLHLADVESGEIDDVFRPDEPVDDRESAWNPDGRHVVIARRYTDERTTRARQLFLLDTQTGSTEELVFDERYFNGFFSWDPQGDQLAIYRFPELTATGENNSIGRPEVWTYDLEADRLTQIAENAYMPQWVP